MAATVAESVERNWNLWAHKVWIWRAVLDELKVGLLFADALSGEFS